MLLTQLGLGWRDLERGSHLTTTGRPTFPWIRLLTALFILILNIPNGGASQTSLGSLVSSISPPSSSKKFFLISSLNLLSFNLKLLLHVLSLQALVKSFSLSVSLLYVLNDSSKASPKPSLLQAEQSHLSHPFLIGELFQPSEHFPDPPVAALGQVWGLWGWILLWVRGSRESRRRERIPSPALLLLLLFLQPGIQFFSLQPTHCHRVADVSSARTLRSFSKGCSQSVHPPVCSQGRAVS